MNPGRNTARGFFMSKHRQMVECRIGKQTRIFRFRMHEISILEEQLQKAGLDKTVPEILESQKIGFIFLREAIMVGVAHEFVGRRGKEARLSAQLVGRWLDECGEEGNDDFDVVASKVIEAVVLGLPGAAKAVREEEERLAALDGDDGDAVEENPLTGTEPSEASALTGTNSSLSPVNAASLQSKSGEDQMIPPRG